MDNFPPSTDIETLQLSNENLEFFTPFIKKTNGETLEQSDIPEAEYYAIVFWNSFMIKPSRKLIKELRKYEKAHEVEEVFYFYVNNHNSEIYDLIPPESRAEYFEQEGIK